VRGLQVPREVSIDTLCVSITDGDHQAPPRAERGIPFITISAMNDGNIDLSKATRFVPAEYVNGLKPSRRPRRGDVLFSVTGSIGIPALVRGNDAFVFQRHIAILKPDLNKTSGQFLAFSLASPQIREQALSVATGTAQLTIPLSGLRKFSVLYPGQDEQAEIVQRLLKASEWLAKINNEVARASELIERLDQSTLNKAFRGQLV
jgi:type I restriction enzyme, S subunit